MLNIATVLWAFNVEKGIDADGNVVTPDPNDLIDTGLVVYVITSPKSVV